MQDGYVRVNSDIRVFEDFYVAGYEDFVGASPDYPERSVLMMLTNKNYEMVRANIVEDVPEYKFVLLKMVDSKEG